MIYIYISLTHTWCNLIYLFPPCLFLFTCSSVWIFWSSAATERWRCLGPGAADGREIDRSVKERTGKTRMWKKYPWRWWMSFDRGTCGMSRVPELAIRPSDLPCCTGICKLVHTVFHGKLYSNQAERGFLDLRCFFLGSLQGCEKRSDS